MCGIKVVKNGQQEEEPVKCYQEIVRGKKIVCIKWNKKMDPVPISLKFKHALFVMNYLVFVIIERGALRVPRVQSEVHPTLVLI